MTCCELCFSSTYTVKECTQQGDPDPGVKDRLKAIEKVVLSLAPGGNQTPLPFTARGEVQQ